MKPDQSLLLGSADDQKNIWGIQPYELLKVDASDMEETPSDVLVTRWVGDYENPTKRISAKEFESRFEMAVGTPEHLNDLWRSSKPYGRR